MVKSYQKTSSWRQKVQVFDKPGLVSVTNVKKIADGDAFPQNIILFIQ